MMDRTKIQVALIQGSLDKASCNFGVLIDSPIKKLYLAIIYHLDILYIYK